MRDRISLAVIVVVSAFILLVAGGVAWAREFAVADPNLRGQAERLIPEGAFVVESDGTKCNATGTWDTFKPEPTCHEIWWNLPGFARAELLPVVEALAEQQGWSVVMRVPSGFDLSRDGYAAVVRLYGIECPEEPTAHCGNLTVVRKAD